MQSAHHALDSLEAVERSARDKKTPDTSAVGACDTIAEDEGVHTNTSIGSPTAEESAPSKKKKKKKKKKK